MMDSVINLIQSSFKYNEVVENVDLQEYQVSGMKAVKKEQHVQKLQCIQLTCKFPNILSQLGNIVVQTFSFHLQIGLNLLN